jgi:hypothetical protein
METKQTAMQELIQWLKIGWKDEDVDTVIKKSDQLLEMEKEQIKNAFDKGYSYYLFNGGGEQYYNETYK